MKKHIVSKMMTSYQIFGMIIFPGWIPVLILIIKEYQTFSLFSKICSFIGISICIAVNIYWVRRYFVDFIFGKFSMDEKGITMYSWTRTAHLDWDECVEYGITGWIAEGAGTGRTLAKNYFVYCSKVFLPTSIRESLVYETNRKKYGDHLLFQYRKELFDEFLTYIPEEWQYRLREQESRLNLNWLERIYNR